MKRIASLTIALLTLCLFAQAAYAIVPGYPLKWSQPIHQIGKDAAGIPIYWGWDQVSFIHPQGGGPQVADDWQCTNSLPVTDFHWWGSYIGSLQPTPPPSKVLGFWFGIYDDIPVQPGTNYSRPGQLLWQYQTTQFTETFVGWDVRMPGTAPYEATFQYNVFLQPSDWWTQPGNNQILWLSIRAIEPTGGFQEWGWKTRPHYFMDDAVYNWNGGSWQEIIGPDGLSWDTSFEISTVPEPGSLAVLTTGLIGLAGLVTRRRR